MTRLIQLCINSKQPQILTLPTGKNPCTVGLGAFWNFGVANYNQIDGKAPLLQGTIGTDYKTAFSPFGRNLSLLSTTLNRIQLASAGTIESPGANDFSVACQLTLRTNLLGYSGISRWESGASPTTDEWFLGGGLGLNSTTIDFIVSVSSTIYQATVSSTSWAIGETYTLFGRRKETTLYVDRYTHSTGALQSATFANAGITTVNTVAARKTKLGELDASGSTNTIGDWYWAGIWNQYVPDSVVMAMALNPWQIYTPSRELWLPPFKSFVCRPSNATFLPFLGS